MTDIDYAALGAVVREYALAEPEEITAHRVVAALRAQGLVVVRRDDLEEMRYTSVRMETSARIATALAAPDDGGEDQ